MSVVVPVKLNPVFLFIFKYTSVFLILYVRSVVVIVNVNKI
jgi:hypothetical protein